MPSNYDTTPIDVSSILGAATQGLLPASQAAFMGGNVEQGVGLQNMNLEQQTKIFDLMGRGAAAADTPDKWNQFVDALEGPGYNGPL